jgi:hypothetical protein
MTIRHLISLVRILSVSGFTSTQNTATMIEALDELGNFLTASQRSVLSENVTITRDELVDVHVVSSAQKTFPRIRRDREITLKDNSDSSDMHVSNKGVAKGDVSVRIQSILDILSSGGSLGIKDIAANLPEYSEKMIQRELLELTSQGKIRKTGLKRWSRYAIA